MKTYFEQIVKEIKEAGCIFVRGNKSNSHVVYRTPEGTNVIIPRKLNDKRLITTIRKHAGVGNG